MNIAEQIARIAADALLSFDAFTINESSSDYWRRVHQQHHFDKCQRNERLPPDMVRAEQ